MRADFDTLAPHVRAAVEEHTGAVYGFRCAASGVNSQLAGVLETAGGRVFLKGVLEADDLQREVDVNPAVQVISPRLLWHEAVDGWHLAAFQASDGRRADYSPGSPDLPKLSALHGVLAELPCPRVPMFSAWRRWGRFLDDPGDAQRFAGDSLLHTDPNPWNHLIGADRTWLVGWAWATRGAAFIDVALLLPRLIDAVTLPRRPKRGPRN